jgi:hypothetical protein
MRPAPDSQLGRERGSGAGYVRRTFFMSPLPGRQMVPPDVLGAEDEGGSPPAPPPVGR